MGYAKSFQELPHYTVFQEEMIIEKLISCTLNMDIACVELRFSVEAFAPAIPLPWRMKSLPMEILMLLLGRYLT